MRNVAYHVPIGYILRAIPEEKDSITFFRLPNGVLAKRVHVWGVVMGKMVGEEYIRFVIDDFTGTTHVVFFEPLLERVRDVEVGDRVDVVGRLRLRNEEVGIVGEVLKIIEPKVEILRRLENLAFVLGIPRSEEVAMPSTPAEKKEEEQEKEEELDVETLDLEGEEW